MSANIGQVIVSSQWRKIFPTLDQLESGETPVLIEHVLPEGITFIGSLSGVGKTWVALSMVKALRTGEPFLGLYKVPAVVPVVYLVPELSGRAVRRRAEKLRIPDSEELRFWTLQQGVMRLNNLYLLKMVSELKPVVFLDTAIRFLSGDENSSSENNSGLAEAIFALLRTGARGVVALHHSPKKASEAAGMTLENVLRGTGDLGALADMVWGIQRARRKKGKQWDAEYDRESRDLTRLRMELVKGRDDEDMTSDLVIQGRPYINDEGNFRVLECDGVASHHDDSVDRTALLVAAIEKNPRVSLRELSRLTGLNTSAVKALGLDAGYRWVPERSWEPFKEAVPVTVDLSAFADPAQAPTATHALS